MADFVGSAVGSNPLKRVITSPRRLAPFKGEATDGPGPHIRFGGFADRSPGTAWQSNIGTPGRPSCGLAHRPKQERSPDDGFPKEVDPLGVAPCYSLSLHGLTDCRRVTDGPSALRGPGRVSTTFRWGRWARE